MKAETINRLIAWGEGKDINPDSIYDTRSLYTEAVSDVLDEELNFDVCIEEGESYIICTYYVNIEGKQGFSAVVNWDCIWGFDTAEAFAKYVAKLYDRAMEIQSYFNS